MTTTTESVLSDDLLKRCMELGARLRPGQQVL